MELRHGRTPRQARARARVERVLDGAMTVFADRGYAKATTNHIAAAAGVHVPSVYQYFSNKDALLAELWDRHVSELMNLLATTLADALGEAIPAIARRYVAAILDIHAARPALLAVLYAEAPRLEGVRDLRQEAIALLVPFLAARADEVRPTDHATTAFVLAAAVEGVARQAVIAPAPPTPQLVDEVTALVTAYLGV